MEIVRYFTKAHQVDPLVEDMDNRTPLHEAALYGHLEVVRFFTKDMNCDPNVMEKIGRAPIHYASQRGFIDIVKYLVDTYQCDPLCQDHNQTPLHVASSNGHMEVVRYFTKTLQVNPQVKNINSSTPLHHSASYGDLKIVKFFIEEMKCDPVCRDQYQAVPLHYAALEGHLEVVKYFTVTLQVNPQVKNKCSETSLHAAARNGRLEVVKFLTVDMKCDPHATNYLGSGPLHLASHSGNLDVVEYLVDTHHCDPMCQNQDKAIPLHYAAHTGHLEVVKYFTITCQVDPQVEGKYELTPLHYAAGNGHFQVVQFLIEDMKCNTARPLSPITLFVLGHSGSGKSTLVKSLSQVGRYFGKCIHVERLSPLTPGIVPTFLDSKTFGNVKIYDIASHEDYYAGHKMLLDHVAEPIVLLTVDISLKPFEVERQLQYWLFVLSNSSTDFKKMHIIIVGSHADLLNHKEKLEINQILKSTKFNKVVITCDCRYSTSNDLNQLRQEIVTVSKSIRANIQSDWFTESLIYYIDHHLKTSNLPTISLNELSKQIKHGADSKPADPELLHKSCTILSSNDYFLFLLCDSNFEDSVLILNEEVVQSQVHTALDEIKKHVSDDVGIIVGRKLFDLLSAIFNYLKPELAIKYLLMTQFCTKILSADQLITNSLSEHVKEEVLYFFPNLVCDTRPAIVDLFPTEKHECTHF